MKNECVSQFRLEAWPFSRSELLFLGAAIAAFAAWDFGGVIAVSLGADLAHAFFGTTGSFAESSTDTWVRVIVKSAVFGTIVSQTTILGVWSSLAEGSTFLRILVTTLILAIGWSLIAAFGRAVGFTGLETSPSGVPFIGKLFVLTLLLCLQVPLYALRVGSGWRLVRQDLIPSLPSNQRRAVLSGLFSYLAFIALLVQLMRSRSFATPGDLGLDTGAPSGWGTLIFLPGLALICAFCGVRFLLILNDRPVFRPVTRLLVSMPVVAVFVACGYHYYESGIADTWVPTLDPVIFAGVVVTQLLAVGIGFATLFAARRFGLRLVTNRSLAALQSARMGAKDHLSASTITKNGVTGR